ncbi:hypothetical protein LINPERPRIM_LOCUS25824 [Linum perenne]
MGVSLVADAPEHLEGRAVFKEIVDHRDMVGFVILELICTVAIFKIKLHTICG